MVTRSNKTTIRVIAEFWSKHVEESDLSIDWGDADEFCWRCGCKRDLHRCHIIPRSLGGEGKPSNFVILCKQCHEDSPDVADPEIIWDWIKAYHTSSYDTFWILQGVKEYSFIYKRTIAEDFMSLGIVDEQGCKTLLSNALKESMWKSITHFGHVRPCAATVAGVLRMALKTIAKEKSIDLPDGRSAENQGVIW